MSTLREAAEKALKALDVATTPLAKDRQEVLSAMAALRAELAKPDARPAPAEPQPAAQQEPAVEHCLWSRNGHARCPIPQRKPLADEQIDRHSIAAVDCPPSSTVILVSSLRRLLNTKGDGHD